MGAIDRLKGHIFEWFPNCACRRFKFALERASRVALDRRVCGDPRVKLKQGDASRAREREIPLRDLTCHFYYRMSASGNGARENRQRKRNSVAVYKRPAPCPARFLSMVSLLPSACNNEMPSDFSRVSTLPYRRSEPLTLRPRWTKLASLRFDSISFL